MTFLSSCSILFLALSDTWLLVVTCFLYLCFLLVLTIGLLSWTRLFISLPLFHPCFTSYLFSLRPSLSTSLFYKYLSLSCTLPSLFLLNILGFYTRPSQDLLRTPLLNIVFTIISPLQNYNSAPILRLSCSKSS